MKRRNVMRMTAAAALGYALPGFAQPIPKVYRIGVLSQVFARSERIMVYLEGRLSELGYQEGRNLVIDFKFAGGKPELLPGLAAELLAAKPDLIVAPLNPEVALLKGSTATIPIVMLFASNPVEAGLIASLARPGGNITGTTAMAPATAGKASQVLRDAVPGLSRITWVAEPDYPGMAQYTREIEKACAAMGLRLTILEVRSLLELDAALAAMARARPEGVAVSMTGEMLSNELRIIEFMSRLKIPALYTTPRPVRSGGLMSYSTDMQAILDRDAWMIDKILKGAKPSEIPVEEPSRFSFKINLKTARAMGFTVPQALLLQADEVFE